MNALKSIKKTNKKNLFKKIKGVIYDNKGKLSILSFGTIIITLFLGQTAKAQSFSVTGITSSVVALAASALTWMISYLFAVVIAVEGYVINTILNISLDIINSPVVQIGFPITLSIANLAFVIALIIMAIATIVRNTNYNTKQMLFKLVTAAIMVNFSLIIAGSLLRISDVFTSFFVQEISPSPTDTDKFFQFTSNIAGAFGPQQTIVVPDKESNFLSYIYGFAKLAGTGTGLIADAVAGKFSDDVGKITVAWIGLIIQIFTEVGIVITLGFLVVMLIYRYITILILLVMMPLAWVMYVFKEYEQYWNAWWKEFTKQLLFAPLMVFFLYLAIQTANGLGETFKKYPKIIPKAFNDSLQGNIAESMVQILSMLTVSGLMLGGTIAASKIGHKTGEAASKTISAARGKITGTLLTRPAGKVGRGIGIVAANSKPAKQLSERLQKISGGFNTSDSKGFEKYLKTGLNAVGSVTGIRQVARVAGSSLDNQTKALSEAQKKSFAEEIKGDSRNINKARLNGGNLSGTEFVEAVKAAIAGGYITEIKNLEQQLANNKDAFASVDEKSLHQKLGGFHYENKEVDKTDANSNKIQKKDAEGKDEFDEKNNPIYEKETKSVLVGDRTLLADTKIAEIKKQIKEKNTSEAQLAALLNDEEELRKTDKDKIIAILEILDKEDKLGLVKDYEKVINYLTKKRDSAGKPIVTEDDKGFTKLDVAGNAVDATYIESIGKDKFIGKVKNATGLSLLEAANLDTNNPQDQEKYQKLINSFTKLDNKAIANLINTNLQTINNPGVTAEQLEQSQLRIATIYKNLQEFQAEKMNGISKELAANDGFTRAMLEKSFERAQNGEYTKGNRFTIQFSKSVMDQAENKPHMQAQILGATLPQLAKIKQDKPTATTQAGGGATQSFFTQQQTPTTGQGNPKIDGFENNKA